MIDSYEIGEVSASLVGLSNRWIIKTFLPIGYFLPLFRWNVSYDTINSCNLG